MDGIKFFHDLDKKEAHKIVISVKSRNVGLLAVKELIATRLSQNAEIALLITPQRTDQTDATEAISAGFHKERRHRRLLNGTQRADTPTSSPT